MTAQLLIVERRYQEAQDCLSRIDLAGLGARSHAVHYVDVATCALYLGDRSLVDQMVPKAIKALENSMDKDDIVYVSCRLATIYSALGQELSATDARKKARDEMAAFRSVQGQLVRTLVRVTEELPVPNKFEHK